MKASTQKEKRHMAVIKDMNCIVCDNYGVDVHHITRNGRRLGHFFTLPLCPCCHRGVNGFDGKNRAAWDKSFDNQMMLLVRVYDKLDLPMPEYKTKVVRRPV